MLIVPFLSQGLQSLLSETELSALDLSGNFVINTDDFVAFRTDRLNRYPESSAIKNVYSRKSSLVGRLLLNAPRGWSSVSQIFNALIDEGVEIGLSTVSKVLKKMESWSDTV